MRTVLLLFFTLFLSKLLIAQQPPDTIPGPFMWDNFPHDGKYMTISPDGKKMLIPDRRYALLVDEGRFEIIGSFWGETISPDFNTWFMNIRVLGNGLVHHGTRGYLKDFGTTAAAKTFVSLLSESKNNLPFINYNDTNYILGIHPNGQLLVTQPWFVGKVNAPAGLKGLWLADRQTGKLLKTLRTDTIMKDNTDIYLPQMGFNSSYTAFLQTLEETRGTIVAYPFGTDSVIISGAKTDVREDFMADAHYIYQPTRNGLDVYSLHTGKLLYRTSLFSNRPNPDYVYRRNVYTLQPDGTIYRFDRETGKLYKEIATGESMQVLRAWTLPMEQLMLAFDQQYVIGVGGNQLFIMPNLRRIGAVPGNAGYVINLKTGNITLAISPFFNPSERVLALEKATEKENELSRARDVVKKKAEEEKLCAANVKDLGLRGIEIGNIVDYGGNTGLLKSYDCKKDEYLFMVPGTNLYSGVATKKLSGFSFRNGAQRSRKDFMLCDVCKGEGVIRFEVEKSNTKELPQGYFSGIKTTVTRTWTEIESKICERCKGIGIRN